MADRTPLAPGETKEYSISYAKEMAKVTDHITASEWVVPEGLTKESEAFTDTAVIVWLSVTGQTRDYKLTNTASTAEGRVYVQSMTVRVKAKSG